MRILHLSDLHICSKNRSENTEHFERLVNFGLNENMDHIIITGDITHNADPKDLETVRNILDSYDLLDSSKLTLVIGNHDIFGGVHLAEDILDFPERCALTNYQQKIREFKYYFYEAFENIFSPDPKNIYPFAKQIDGILFVGINSIAKYSKVKNLFASKGIVNKTQINDLIKIFDKYSDDDLKKVILTHHHFSKHYAKFDQAKKTFLQNIEGRAMRLRKKKRLMEVFSKYEVDLILHGHLHESIDYWKNNLHFVNAGGCIDGNKPNELKANLIDIQQDNIEIDIRSISCPERQFIHRNPAKRLKKPKPLHNSLAFSS